MNGNLDQKKEYLVEEALKLKDEGRRLPYIIEKFPDYESEIREIFGTVAFIRENDNKVSAPKNILKTLLSKMTGNSGAQSSPRLRREIDDENSAFVPITKNDEEAWNNVSSIILENNTIFGKWKIIIPVIILAIAMGVMLLRSDSRTKDEIINENIETTQNSEESNSVPNTNDISSSTEKNDN